MNRKHDVVKTLNFHGYSLNSVMAIALFAGAVEELAQPLDIYFFKIKFNKALSVFQNSL
jgi:hypothetical protein